MVYTTAYCAWLLTLYHKPDATSVMPLQMCHDPAGLGAQIQQEGFWSERPLPELQQQAAYGGVRHHLAIAVRLKRNLGTSALGAVRYQSALRSQTLLDDNETW